MIQLALEEHSILVENGAPFLNGKKKTLNRVSLYKHSVSRDSKGTQFKRNHTVHANDYDKLIYQNNVCSVCLMKCVFLYIFLSQSYDTAK